MFCEQVKLKEGRKDGRDLTSLSIFRFFGGGGSQPFTVFELSLRKDKLGCGYDCVRHVESLLVLINGLCATIAFRRPHLRKKTITTSTHPGSRRTDVMCVCKHHHRRQWYWNTTKNFTAHLCLTVIIWLLRPKRYKQSRTKVSLLSEIRRQQSLIGGSPPFIHKQ